ncbi:MAG: alpha/beta hydrolase [Deltaproteobacteria bacterium]|nr:alpha/beta hydrolase [Deltaproteobacteria bacterium]
MNKNFVEPADRYLVSDGVKLHYAEWGDPTRETLILVHGNRDHCRSWDFFVAALGARGSLPFHVVALDLRGHGDSEWHSPDRQYQHEDFLLDLSCLIRHLGKETFSLAGHSLGGAMAVLYSGCFPERIRRLVLVEALGPYARSDQDVPRLLAQWLGENGSASERFYPDMEEAAKAIQKRFPTIPDGAALYMARYGMKRTENGWIWKYDPRVRFPSFSTFSEAQIQAFIHRIECPTLLVYGEAGEFMKSPRAYRVSLFKNMQVMGIADAGHHVPHEKPNELAGVVYPFLRARSPNG